MRQPAIAGHHKPYTEAVMVVDHEVEGRENRTQEDGEERRGASVAARQGLFFI